MAAAYDRCVLVTGGAGFIGSGVCRYLVAGGRTRMINLDVLSYAALWRRSMRSRVRPITASSAATSGTAVSSHNCSPRNESMRSCTFAAESHVDRSLDGPAVFVATNITGTFHLLEAALDHWRVHEGEAKARFRFHPVSTDEVFGDLPFDLFKFDETSPYRPSSPYSTSKAASDHLVRAWHHSYRLPVVLSNCSNNYGPWQFPEKLIPLTITRALAGETLPVYSTGENVRDCMSRTMGARWRRCCAVGWWAKAMSSEAAPSIATSQSWR